LVCVALLLLRRYAESCFFGSGFVAGYWVIVLVVTSSLAQKVWFVVFDFRSCCKTALFQQQPAGMAEHCVLASAIGRRCYWLHFDSASTSIIGLLVCVLFFFSGCGFFLAAT
jgi:hypothetical protein